MLRRESLSVHEKNKGDDANALHLKVFAYLSNSTASYSWVMKRSGCLVFRYDTLKSPDYSDCPVREDIMWPKGSEALSIISSVPIISKSNLYQVLT
jgi:hypothetical protein